MFILKSKLKRVKLALRSWNWEVFGNIHEGVRSSWQSLDSIQREIHENGRTDQLTTKEIEAQGILQRALHIEDAFWREKTQVLMVIEILHFFIA